MAEPESSDPGSPGGNSETDAEDTLEAVDYLIDLATNRHIDDDESNAVCKDFNEAYEWMVDAGYAGSAESARTGDSVKDNGNDSITIEALTNADGESHVTFYLEGGEAWKQIREQFEYIKPVYEQVLSYPKDELTGCIAQLELTRRDLTPASDLESQAESFLELDIESSETEKEYKETFKGLQDNWQGAGFVSQYLAPWNGDAATTFKTLYTDRIPSIVTGQMLVALVLEQSMDVVSQSFRGLRTESAHLLSGVTDLLELYPDTGSTEAGDGVKWKTIAENVAGVAAVVSGTSAVLPGPGTAISTAAAFVGASATLGAMVLEDEDHKSATSDPGPVEGDTVPSIMSSFANRIDKYIAIAQSTEQILASRLSDFTDFVRDTSAKGITIPRVDNDDLILSQRECFFELPKPGIGNIDSNTSYSKMTADSQMGSPPSKGGNFGTELKGLYKAGHEYLPELASTFSNMAGKGADDGLESAFSRTVAGQNEALGHYEANGGQGPLLPVWTELYEELDIILKNTGDHLDLAAKGLISAADAYAQQDDEAAANLRETSEYYDG